MVALAKSPPESMKEMLLNAQKYMNAKDAIAVIGMGDTQKEEGDRLSSHDNARSRSNKTRRKVNFTPPNDTRR